MNNTQEILVELYQQILLSEKFAEIFQNDALDIIRYFKCIKLNPLPEQCPDPAKIVQKIKNWLAVNKNHPAYSKIHSIVNSSSNPKEILAELNFRL
jgi:hypothetical protein